MGSRLTQACVAFAVGAVVAVGFAAAAQAQAAWEAGARAVNPTVQVRVTYLNSFDDIAAGREAALAMLQLGVDMFHHNADAAALGMFQAVRESPSAFAFGANADQSSLAPERVIGSAVIDLPRAFLAVAREVQAGRFVARVESFGLASGVVRYVPNPALARSIPEALAARVAAAADSIATADPDDSSRP